MERGPGMSLPLSFVSNTKDRSAKPSSPLAARPHVRHGRSKVSCGPRALVDLASQVGKRVVHPSSYLHAYTKRENRLEGLSGNLYPYAKEGISRSGMWCLKNVLGHCGDIPNHFYCCVTS